MLAAQWAVAVVFALKEFELQVRSAISNYCTKETDAAFTAKQSPIARSQFETGCYRRITMDGVF